MPVYPSLEHLKLGEFAVRQKVAKLMKDHPSYVKRVYPTLTDEQPWSSMNPMLNDYSNQELGILTQINCLAISTQPSTVRVTNGVRKLRLFKDLKGLVGLKLSKFNHGIFVSDVILDSPAAKERIKFGDQLLQINNNYVMGMSIDMVNRMFRGSFTNYIDVIVRDRPLECSISFIKDHPGSVDKVGFQLKNGKIINVSKNSSAARNGVLPGHHLLEVNGQNVIGIDDIYIMKIFKTSPDMITITTIPNSIYDHLIKKTIGRSINLYKDHTGSFGFQFSKGKIVNIFKDSSADRNGMLTDHILLNVNGQNVIGLEDKDIVDIFKNSPDMITIKIIPESMYSRRCMIFMMDFMIKKIAPCLIKSNIDFN